MVNKTLGCANSIIGNSLVEHQRVCEFMGVAFSAYAVDGGQNCGIWRKWASYFSVKYDRKSVFSEDESRRVIHHASSGFTTCPCTSVRR